MRQLALITNVFLLYKFCHQVSNVLITNLVTRSHASVKSQKGVLWTDRYRDPYIGPQVYLGPMKMVTRWQWHYKQLVDELKQKKFHHCIALLSLSRFNKIKSKFWSLFAGYKTNPVRWTQTISLMEHQPGLISSSFWTNFPGTKTFWHFNLSQSHSTAAFTEYNQRTEFKTFFSHILEIWKPKHILRLHHLIWQNLLSYNISSYKGWSMGIVCCLNALQWR